MKKTLHYFIIWMLVMGWLVPSWIEADTPLLTEGIAAAVNGEPITFLEINLASRVQESDLRKQYEGDALKQKMKALKIQVCNDLIDQLLIVQEFHRQGGFMPESYLNQRVQDVIKSYYQGDENGFNKALAANGETLDEYKAQLDAQAIVVYMTKRCVTDKITATVPGGINNEREAIRNDWLASLRKAASIEMMWRSALLLPSSP